MSKIHLLDNETVNKIAAGEVIENPKSIVKELVENSIDSGADEIIVEIKNGGKSLIRISDNGKGINRDEIEDAFKRHFTSKITTSDDLNSLFTLGFRGEALASIAAVAHVEMITRIENEQYGVKMIIKGGTIESKEDIGCPVGTTITVTDLFFNVPARKKFLKSDATESGNINEVVMSLALSKENISFKYINNSNIAFKTPKTNNFLNTISSLYERDLYESLITVDYKGDIVNILGYTTNLNYYRGNRKHQLIFVNGRIIKHKRINYFIEAAYNTLLPKNKYPACFLKLEIDPSLVDVNVHPAKTEVRFQNEDLVLNEVKRAIYKALNNKSIVKEIKKETIIQKNTSNKINNIFEYKNDNINSENKNIDFKDLISVNNIKLTEIKSDDEENNINNTFSDIIDEVIKDEISIFESEGQFNTEDSIFEEDLDLSANPNTLIVDEDEEDNLQQSIFSNEERKNRIPELLIIGILMDTYIICESRETSEMFMIDQHAAHERINYEKFLNQYNEHNIVLQELMIPEVINLSYEDYYLTVNNKEIFEKIGIIIENFGINAILINSVPLIFSKSNIKELFYTILDSIKNTNKSILNIEMDKIIKEACVKSVKSGDKLHQLEIKKLIDDLKNTENPYTCPHGRPVIIKMSKYEIERMFERIQN